LELTSYAVDDSGPKSWHISFPSAFQTLAAALDSYKTQTPMFLSSITKLCLSAHLQEKLSHM